MVFSIKKWCQVLEHVHNLVVFFINIIMFSRQIRARSPWLFLQFSVACLNILIFIFCSYLILKLVNIRSHVLSLSHTRAGKYRHRDGNEAGGWGGKESVFFFLNKHHLSVKAEWCMRNLASLGVAMVLCCREEDGAVERMPYSGVWSTWILQLTDPDVLCGSPMQNRWVCPTAVALQTPRFPSNSFVINFEKTALAPVMDCDRASTSSGHQPAQPTSSKKIIYYSIQGFSFFWHLSVQMITHALTYTHLCELTSLCKVNYYSF